MQCKCQRKIKKEEDIVNIIKTELNPIEKSLNNKKILITAGRTEEAVDPVRYLSNRSTGQMGYSLASAAAQLGAEVTLVSGPTNLSVPEGVKNFLQVRSAQEMFDTVMEYYDSQDAAIACAAVADYKVKEYSTHKIKKKDDDMVLVLDRNPDILYEMGQKKNKQFLIGFAAESENLIENATRKLQKKNLDLIVGNLVTYMQSSNNQVTLLKKDGSKIEIPEMKKQELAFNILKEIKF